MGDVCFRPASETENAAEGAREASSSGAIDPEVDFVVDAGARMELFEAKCTELPDAGGTVNLDFVRNVMGSSRVAGGAAGGRAPNGFPLVKVFRALP